MKTRPFDASKHKPGDKLVCGGDPVTELIVGDSLVAGIRENIGKFVCMWTRDGRPSIGADYALEVLIPEPEKPREWWIVLSKESGDYDRAYRYGAHRDREVVHVREVAEPEEAKPTPESVMALATTPAHGWVPLHNGEPKWVVASGDKDVGEQIVRDCKLTGPVVPCFVAREPMTREEAREIAQRHDLRGKHEWAIDVALEASQWHVRAEG